MDHQPAYQHQSPAPYDPAKRRRGPVLLVVALLVVLLVVIGLGAFLLLRDDGTAAPDPERSTPASPGSVQLRRVVTAAPCTDKAADCEPDGFRYQLGAVELDGGHIESVTAALGQGARWQVAMTLDADGSKLFGKLTTELTAKGPPANQLAIVVRGRVVSAPTVSSPITGGKLEISGNFTKDTAEKLVAEITG